MAEAGAGRGAAALRVGVRQRFSGFYDLNVRQDGGEHDLDSANFAAESYVQSVLKSKTLPQLVHHSNELSLEIKELDSDMQMLVYENYNKFISATETIQDMKSKVDSMEGEMGRLAAAVSEITESSARINDNLSDRRLRIQKLNGVRRLLKKLSFVFELPTRLKRAVELDAGAEALKYWRTALPVLTAYAHVPSFQAVENEAREILRQLEERLRARLQAADTPPAEAQEAATLLIDLGQPARPIRLQFVALISARLRLPVVLDQLPVAPERIQGGYALSDPNGALSCHFVQGIKSMVLGYQMLLQNAHQDGGGDARAAGAAADDAAVSASGQNEEDEQQVVKVVDEMLERYFAALRVVADAPARQEDAVALIQQLEKWHGDVRGLESLLPPVPTLAGAADDIITRILRARVAFTFGNVAAMWRDALVALSLASTAPKDSWVSAVDVAYGKAMASFQEGIAAIRPIFIQRAPVLDSLRGQLAVDLSTQVVTLVEQTLVGAAGGGDGETERGWIERVEGHVAASGEMALLLSLVWRKMRDEGLGEMATVLRAIGKSIGVCGIEGLGPRLGKAVTALRLRYLLVRRLAIGKSVQRAMALAGSEAGASGLEQVLLKAVAEVRLEIQSIMPSTLGMPEGAESGSMMDALRRSREAIEEVGGDEGAALVKALVVHVLHDVIEQIRVRRWPPAMGALLKDHLAALKVGMEKVGGGLMDMDVGCLLEQAKNEVDERCV